MSYVYLGYRHAITKWIPELDSPHREHSFEPLNVLFAPFLGLLASIFHLVVLDVAYFTGSLIYKNINLKLYKLMNIV